MERLESRIAPAFTAVLSGAIATFVGDAADDTLVFSAESGLLKHNRFSGGDAGFASDLDFDSTVAGIQTLAADVGNSVSINLGTGLDTVILGGNHRAALLSASFTVTNNGADGDVLEVNDSASTDPVTLALFGATLSGSNITVNRAGDTFGTFRILTGSGADSLTFGGVLAVSNVFNMGAGNDTVSGQTGTSAVHLIGGPGNDDLSGGDQGDVFEGGQGNDILNGRRGNDVLFGGEGSDTFSWNPGDGSDTIEGGAGADVMIFNGANISESFTLSAVNDRFQLFRDVANILMDVGTVEEVQLNLLGGADNVILGDISATTVRTIRLGFGSTIGGVTPDGQVDSLSMIGSALDDDVRVRSEENTVQVVGLAPYVELTGIDTFDQLKVAGGAGIDNIVATSAALTKMGVTLDGETENPAPLGFHVSAPVSYDVGNGPSSIAAGNLFGPGNDLVIANTKSNSISVLFNAGDGTFLPALSFATGKAPKSVVLEDFNGDLGLDIAVTNSGSGNVSVFLNNGDGTFSAPTLFSVGKKPGVLRAGDVTGDDQVDLVMITAGNSLTVLAGDGAGGFGAPVRLSTGGKTPVDVVLADFSGDAVTDIAVAHAASNNVTFFQANADFTFAAPVVARVGVKPTALVTGDFNGDGRIDLAVAHSVSRFVSVLLNASTGNATEFSGQFKLANPGRNVPLAIAAGDVNMDGRVDLVVANSAAGTVGVFLNTGPAIFETPLNFDLDNTPARKSSSLTLSDLNGDGRLDIAVPNAGTSDLSLLYRVIV